MTETVTLRLANRLSEIPVLAERVEAVAAAHGLPPGVIFKLNLVLDEVLTNVIDYAYQDDQPHEIQVVLAVDGDGVVAEVIDDGRAYDPTATPDPDITLGIEERPIGGLGIFFAKRMMDRVEYRRDGAFNRLLLAKGIGVDR